MRGSSFRVLIPSRFFQILGWQNQRFLSKDSLIRVDRSIFPSAVDLNILVFLVLPYVYRNPLSLRYSGWFGA